MGAFKPAPAKAANKSAARLDVLTWLLIYGGLLTLVLGIWVERIDDDTGWSLLVGGGIVAAVGAGLIYLRSRIGNGPDA